MMQFINIKKFALSVIACSITISGYTQSLTEKNKVLSLDTVLNRIAENNISLQSYALKAESYKYKGEATTSWMAPMVGLGTYMTPYPGAMVMDPADKGSLMFQIEQAIPSRRKLNAKKRAIQSLGEVERVNREITLNDLKAQAKLLYVNGVIAEKRINLLAKSERIITMMKKVEELRYTYNKAMLGSIYKIEGQLATNRNQIAQQEGDIQRIKAVLNSLMNLPQANEFELDTAVNQIPNLTTFGNQGALIQNRADLLKVDKSIAAMKFEIEALNLQKRPDFSIRFDHMSPLAKSGMAKSYSIMGMVSIPIAPWSAKMYKAETKAMEYDILAMEKEKEATTQRANGVLYGLHYQIQSLEKQVQGIEGKVIPALQKSFDAYFVNYQENKLELPVVIDAWEALLMMKMNLLEEKLKLYELTIDYEKEIYQ